ncbi:hypothetical protein CV093_03480 [Oceanobacillus sp. 143]|uniref:Uncharacterized protein n=1 Tax=Oceanobacillus zhaokaii TaxID=2052660 RepID=A0A345PDI4_9BACI|nr:hypothetical protein CUC15_03380 [Oceanobacillus zhaokaii]QGS68052.1 hypothetical protein CV093_03480 [Oceanobacillus sp. 143]
MFVSQDRNRKVTENNKGMANNSNGVVLVEIKAEGHVVRDRLMMMPVMERINLRNKISFLNKKQ